MSNKSDTSELTHLGSKRTDYPKKPDVSILETFKNPNQKNQYSISLNIPEFTCLCPLTSQPDYATIVITYVPDAKCVESKSLKLYMFAFRNVGSFHEAVVNRILDDLVEVLKPIYIKVNGLFNARGGINLSIVAEWSKPQAPGSRIIPAKGGIVVISLSYIFKTNASL